jgi:hypothetical protein
MRRRAGVLALLAALALGVAACGESPEDKARDDGKEVGAAMGKLYSADDADAAREAAEELRTAVQQLREDASERAGNQVQVQSETLQNAVEELQQSSDAEDARTELQSAIQQIRSQAESFQGQNDSIANEFWRGFEEGFDDND